MQDDTAPHTSHDTAADSGPDAASGPPLLEDGTYDALVVDVDPTGGTSARLDLTIVAGRHKGEVVGVRAAGLADDPMDLLGMPAVLVVTNGQPSVAFDDE
jgi:hypothetical protein